MRTATRICVAAGGPTCTSWSWRTGGGPNSVRTTAWDIAFSSTLLRDMSRNYGGAAAIPVGEDEGVPSSDDKPVLSGEQQETWFAYMRLLLRLPFEMNRQLQADSELSLPDFDVLNALADSPDQRCALSVLATRLGWERSRLSHHLLRMSKRGLLARAPSVQDGRVT